MPIQGRGGADTEVASEPTESLELAVRGSGVVGHRDVGGLGGHRHRGVVGGIGPFEVDEAEHGVEEAAPEIGRVQMDEHPHGGPLARDGSGQPLEVHGMARLGEASDESVELPHRRRGEVEPDLTLEHHGVNVHGSMPMGVAASMDAADARGGAGAVPPPQNATRPNTRSTSLRRVALVGQRTFDDLGAPLSEVPFCVLDLETTGLAPDTCEITEIGAVRFVGGVESGRFHTLVNPRAPIPPTVTVVTGITQAMVVDAPLIEEALPAFLEFLGDAVIVGHNVRFDIAFLNAAALRLGYGRLHHRSADTLRLARRLLPGEVRNLRLAQLAAHLGSPVVPTHRAFDDAMATAHVFWALLERAGSIGVTHLDDLLALPTIKGSRAIGKLALTEDLPRGPGIYLFRDRAGHVVYVGKATNLRSRVRSYFAGDHRKQVDAMLRDLTRIDHVATTSEIEAAVLELRTIEELRPRYNRRSKPPRSLHWVSVTDERFPRLSITRSTRKGLIHLGPFRTRATAELVMHALWDASRIRRCTTAGRGCDYAQLGRAVCPCDGTVGDEEYRGIVDDLLAGLEGDPGTLLTPIVDRLSSLVAHQRFEEAASCRDGWGHLARTLRRRRHWTALQCAGNIVARRGGAMVAISGGRLMAAWRVGGTPPLVAVGDVATSRHPESMAAADEAALLWAWLVDDATELVSVSGEFALPATPVPELDALPHATVEPGGTSRSGASSTTPSVVRAPRTRTSERNPAMRRGARPVTTTTWRPTSAAGS